MNFLLRHRFSARVAQIVDRDLFFGVVRRRSAALMVTFYHLEHNHQLNRFPYERFPINRRLTLSEMNECEMLLQYGSLSCEVRRYFA